MRGTIESFKSWKLKLFRLKVTSDTCVFLDLSIDALSEVYGSARLKDRARIQFLQTFTWKENYHICYYLPSEILLYIKIPSFFMETFLLLYFQFKFSFNDFHITIKLYSLFSRMLKHILYLEIVDKAFFRLF